MNHSHILYDSDPHFRIDPISRNIINESSTKVRLIQYDHNSERFTFEIPQYVEGHDMSLCNLVEIHYVNVEANTKVIRGGVYTVDDLQVKSGNDSLVVFSWTIPRHATQYVGQLQFLVRFSCMNDSTGQIDYVWNTGICTGITVASGIYNSDSPSDNPVPAYNFVTTLDGSMLKFYVTSEEEYHKLAESGLIVPNCLYITTDDDSDDESSGSVTLETLREELSTVQDTLTTIEEKHNELNSTIEGIGNGTVAVDTANNIHCETMTVDSEKVKHVSRVGLYIVEVYFAGRPQGWMSGTLTEEFTAQYSVLVKDLEKAITIPLSDAVRLNYVPDSVGEGDIILDSVITTDKITAVYLIATK